MKLTIRDYTRYVPERSHNGGDYGFEEGAEITRSDLISGGYYWTTSDFDYCEKCGTFQRDARGHDRYCDSYQPSDMMACAFHLVCVEHFPADQAVVRFDAWANGPTLTISD